MKDNKLNELFIQIRNECLEIINKKNVDVDELSFQMGMSSKTLYNFLKNKNEDFSIYLKLYEVLLGW